MTSGTASAPLAITLGDAESATSTLTVQVFTTDDARLPNSALVLGGSGANRTLTITPPSGQSGTVEVALVVNDGQLATARFLQVTIQPGQMTSGERVRYEMGRLGTAAATASGGLGLSDDIARYLPPVLTAPHRAPGSSARVLAGDTAAGIGSGATVGSYDEYAPDWLRERLGPVGDLIAGLVGGIGGSRLVGAGEAIARRAANVPKSVTYVPENMIPADPETMLPAKRSDLARASYLVQEKASDPAAAAAEIERYLATAGSGAQLAPPSSLRQQPPQDTPTSKRRGSRGSTTMLWMPGQS